MASIPTYWRARAWSHDHSIFQRSVLMRNQVIILFQKGLESWDFDYLLAKTNFYKMHVEMSMKYSRNIPLACLCLKPPRIDIAH